VIKNKIATVQCYIHHVKNIEVDITPPTNVRQQMLLDEAYLTARKYFQ